MKPTTWFFVCDHDGMELAAFPERDLAEAYMEDMPWEIEERIITTDSTFVSATLYDETLRRAEQAEADGIEQARLLGMSAEREADLLGKLERAEQENAALRAAMAFYADPQTYGHNGGNFLRIANDSGKQARAALAGKENT